MSDLDIDMHNASMDAINETSKQEMETFMAEILGEYEECDYQPAPDAEPATRHVTANEIIIGEVYFSDVQRDHYYITSVYNDPTKWKVFWAKVWRSDNKRSEKKTQLHEGTINHNYFKKSTNATVLSSLWK